jgi:hypothetical protein
MIVNLNSLDALRTPPPTGIDIVETSGQKFLDGFGQSLAMLRLVVV